jgi:multiple sugar transport system substrate-binding protein
MAEEFSGTNQWFDENNRCIINSPDHVEGLAFWNALYQDRLVPEDSINWGYTELVQGFWSGVCGCVEQDNEVVGTCLEHGMDTSSLATAIMPAGPKARVTSNDIWNLSMSSQCRNKEAGWEFISWLLSPEQNLIYCRDVGVISPLKQGFDDPELSTGLYRPFMDMINDPAMLQNWYPNYLPEMGEFVEVMVTREQQNMLLGKQSPQQTLDRLADFIQKAQDKYTAAHGPDTPRPPV